MKEKDLYSTQTEKYISSNQKSEKKEKKERIKLLKEKHGHGLLKADNLIDTLFECDEIIADLVEDIFPIPKQKKNREPKPSRIRPVIQLTRNSEFIAEFPSVVAAFRATGIYSSGIYNVCQRFQSHAGGYLWSYKENRNG